jgi:hypothetical protein
MTIINQKSISGITSITFASAGDDLLTFHSNNGTERFRIDNSGNTRITAGIVTTLSATGDVDVADKIVHTGDTNTAIRFPAADTFTVETGGSERFRIDSTGNTLIYGVLRKDNINSSLSISGGNGADSSANIVLHGSSGSPANVTQFRTGSTERARIDSSGNFGVGTNSPNAGLNVGLGGNTIPAAGASTGSALFGNATGGNAYGLVLGATSGGVGYIAAQRADGTGTTYNLIMQPNGGSIGVGTDSPTTQSGKTLHLHNGGGQQRLHLTTNNSGSEAGKGLDIILEHNTDGDAHILNHNTNGDLKLGAGDAERLRILSSGGLTFNGDTAQANALDDYEEGTWTPTFGIASVTVSNAVYTKIGRLVTVTAGVTIPNTTNTATINIGGLPFTPDGFMNSAMGGVVGETTLTTTDRPVACVEAASNVVRFRQNGSTALTFANLSQETLRWMVTYFTDQ